MPSVHVTIYEPDEFDPLNPNPIPTTVWVRGAVRPRNTPVEVTALFGLTPKKQPATHIDNGRRWETEFTNLPAGTSGSFSAQATVGGSSGTDSIFARTVGRSGKNGGKKGRAGKKAGKKGGKDNEKPET